MKQDGKNRQQHGAVKEEPHVGTRSGHALDGSQYVDVVEEQRYADQPANRDAREPHRIHNREQALEEVTKGERRGA